MATHSTPLTFELSSYITSLFSAEDVFLQQLLKEAADRHIPAISIGAEQTSFLQVLLRSIGAKTVVEVGSLAGYSAITMARALPANGVLHACELNHDYCDFIERKVRQAELQNIITVHRGEALPTLQRLCETHAGTVDAVFIDADKRNYSAYLDCAIILLRLGGVVIGDNALAWGEVANPNSTFEPENVSAIRAFNHRMSTHPQLQSTLVPLGDGMAIGVKRI
jgi:caffeoyl-CoA O-methyltransferase